MDEFLPIFAALIGSGVTAAVASAWSAWRSRSHPRGEETRMEIHVTDKDSTGVIIVGHADAEEILTRMQRVSDDVEDLKDLLADDLHEKKTK